MVDEILKETGIPYKETRFNKVQQSTYAIYNDKVKKYGADKRNFLEEHIVTIELYSYTIDLENEQKIESQLDKKNIDYEKSERKWLEDENIYQVIFIFKYVNKLKGE